jgi:hypothetical protein
MSTQPAELNRTWARVVAKAWIDEDFKRRLIADPAGVARDEGMPIPQGLTVRVVEDAPGMRTLVLPPQPTDVGGVDEVEQRLAGCCGLCFCG